MQLNLHKNATTTPHIRKLIQNAPKDKSNNQLAKEFKVSYKTIKRWRERNDVFDRSHTPHNLKTSLSAAEEEIVIELRKTLLLTLDDLLRVVREFVKPDCSRSALYRCLKRNDVADLKKLIPQEEGKKKVKTFKDYKPGFIHIDIKYLPQMSDEESRSYLFVAIDRATRWVFMEIFPDKSAESSAKFLDLLIEASPIKINKILTDNGKEFTDRFNQSDRRPSGNHVFDLKCKENNIEHRLIRPRHPQTNGMVERFNGRISKIMKTTRFRSASELRDTLKTYLYTYNHMLPQRALDGRVPVEVLIDYYQKEPQLFRFNPANLAEPNTPRCQIIENFQSEIYLQESPMLVKSS